MYSKPEVTRYSGSELLDLMGPVETGYECNVLEAETTFIANCPDNMQIVFQVPPPEPPGGWDHIRYSATPLFDTSCSGVSSSPIQEDLVSNVDEENSIITLDFPGSQTHFCEFVECSDDGEYRIELWLVDSDEPANASEKCRVTIERSD